VSDPYVCSVCLVPPAEWDADVGCVDLLPGRVRWTLKDTSRVCGQSSTVVTERIYWWFFEDELPMVPSMNIRTREAVIA
jgi:hypothetical protein